MSKLDDGDGLYAEDGGSDLSDNDGDLALDEDPADAIRLRVDGSFLYIGGLLCYYGLQSVTGNEPKKPMPKK